MEADDRIPDNDSCYQIHCCNCLDDGTWQKRHKFWFSPWSYFLNVIRYWLVKLLIMLPRAKCVLNISQESLGARILYSTTIVITSHEESYNQQHIPNPLSQWKRMQPYFCFKALLNFIIWSIYCTLVMETRRIQSRMWNYGKKLMAIPTV